MSFPSDFEIASAATLRPITDVAAELGLELDDLDLYGSDKAKLRRATLERLEPRAKLVVVTATTPTRAGEGKTTVSVGLSQALRRIGQKVATAIREPSLGPVFGIKGGAAGGGYSQVLPMEDINLHFTGDLHAITSANGLLAAAIDNHMQQGNKLGIDPRRITWRRCIDMNDRALRRIVIGLGGPMSGVPREDGFVITAASEVMATFCLATDIDDLEVRLGRIIIGADQEGRPVLARDLGVTGAMTMLLRDAIRPNLVQTIEGGPAFVHGGPFANIAHGCNTLAATRAAMSLADVVITEAGFGSDLGFEKFCNIKCRLGGISPQAAVLVTTIRALKLHGGAAAKALTTEDVGAVVAGTANLDAHVANVRQHGLPPLVAINRFASDSDAEVDAVLEHCAANDVRADTLEIHSRGGEGGESFAHQVVAALDSGEADFKHAYETDLPIADKIEAIATSVYGADRVQLSSKARKAIDFLEANGLGSTPVCMAKTPASLTDDASRLGRPTDFSVSVQDVTPSAGAGFVVAHLGNVMTMPGLPKVPAANRMRVTPEGGVEGLF
ncbi:MAG TPA: formate--tetrahydrofolate ligase [Acidobacteriota bacterium]|nr:formate--tetrahydrofolate ligase [Acidobacteriota bacterium]